MTSGQTKVSVVIPAYNSEKTIRRTVESVLGQSYGNIEIIVVDDGSTDGTGAAITELINGSKITYVQQEKTSAASARNTGLKKSTGDYVALLDSDDVFEDEKIQKQLAHMKEHGLEFSFTGFYVEGPEGELQEWKSKKRAGIDLKDDLLNEPCILTSTVMASRTALDKVGLFDENFIFCEDWDWFFRMVMKTKTGYLEDILTTKHNTSGSLSSRYKAKYKCYLQLLNKHIRSLDKINQKKFKAGIGNKCYTDAVKNFRAGNFAIGLKAFMASVRLRPVRILKLPSLLKRLSLR